MIKMIVMDLDGTLLDDDENISPYTLSILKKCKQAGIKIVIATARSRIDAEEYIDPVEADFSILNDGALLILNDGCLILDEHNEIIHNKLLPLRMLDEIDDEYLGNMNGWKMNAIEIIAEKLNIPLSEIAAFGDGFNDVEMIKNCGMGIAMENAVDAAKRFSKDICGSNNEDGVAKWIEKHVLPLSVYDMDKKL